MGKARANRNKYEYPSHSPMIAQVYPRLRQK